MTIDYERLNLVNIRYSELRVCNRHFRNHSERLVEGEGLGPIKFMVIGEAPGAQEDMALRPFVGPAGIMLRRLIDTVYPGSNIRQDAPRGVWLTNVVKHRPPMNRTPNVRHIGVCRKLLNDEWCSIGCPTIIVTVGGVATQAVWGAPIAVSTVAGEPFGAQTRQGIYTTVWPMYHPSFGLRNPSMQPVLDEHWRRFGDWLVNHA